MSLELAANPACCAAVLTSLFTSASAEAGRTPRANSQAHARASAPNIASSRSVCMISLPLFGKAGCAELKDEGQGCASPFNLGSHKGKAVRQAIKAAGAHLLFLPKCSPDLNPIE